MADSEICAFPGCARPRRPRAGNAGGKPPKYCDLTNPATGKYAHSALTAARARAAGDTASAAPSEDREAPASAARERARTLHEQFVGDTERLASLLADAVEAFREAGDPDTVGAELNAARRARERGLLEADERITAAETERDAAEQQRDEATAAADAAREARDEAISELEAAEISAADLRSEVDQVSVAHGEVTAQLNTLTGQHRELTTEHEELRRKHDETSANLTQARVDLDAADQRDRDQAAQLAEVRRDYALAQEQIAGLRNELRNVQDDLATEKTETARAGQQRDDTAAELAETRRTARETAELLADQRAQVAGLTAEVKAAEKSQAAAAEAFERERRGYLDRLEDLRGQLRGDTASAPSGSRRTGKDQAK